MGNGAHSCLIKNDNLTWPIGAPIEDTIAGTQFIMRGIPIHYPDMKIILSHLGGALPMLLGRLDDQSSYFLQHDYPEMPSTMARKMWYDTVGHHSQPALKCACDAFGVQQLLLGTDFPYQQNELHDLAVTYIEISGMSESDIEFILDRNAGEGVNTGGV